MTAITDNQEFRTMRVVVVDVPIQGNDVGNAASLTDSAIVITELSSSDTVPSEAAIAWGPSVVDEDVLAQLEAIRAVGYRPLPAQGVAPQPAQG